MGLSQALSASDIKKMRKMSWVNFAFTILQVGASCAPPTPHAGSTSTTCTPYTCLQA
jgi:hypothetical protein